MDMLGPQSFCLSVYSYDNDILQSLVDAVNMALRMYPEAWNFVVMNGLMYKYPNPHPVSEKIFDGVEYEIEALRIVTELAQKRAGLN